MSVYLGDYPASATVDFKWSSNGQDGASITRATDGSIRIYKNNSTTERSSSGGITDTEDFDSVTGVHHLRIDLSDNTDAGFYAAGNEYFIVLSAATIDGKTVNQALAQFSIERANGILALLKSGTFGLSALNTKLGAPAGASVSADVAAVKAVLPAALVSGRIDASVGAMASGVLTATAIAADAITDAKVASDVTIASVTGAVGSVTGNVGGNVVGSIGSLSVQAKADVNAEADTALSDAGVTTTVTGRIDAAISTRLAADSYTAPLDAAGVRSAVGLASANLDTQLGAIAGYVDTEIGALQTTATAIKNKTDNLPASPAAVGDAMTLTSGERTAIANEVEAQIIDDTDSEKVLQAIVNKIAAANPDLSGLTLSAIASAVRSELTIELARIDAAVSSRLAAVSYTAPLDAAGVRSAVGLASANLDTQLDALPTNTELATALGTADDATLAAIAALSIPTAAQVRAEMDSNSTKLAHLDADVSSRLAGASYTAPDNTSIGAIKTQTDKLSFTVANQVDSNVQYVNDTQVTGNGQSGTEWGPA